MTYHIENTFESLPEFLDYLKTTEPAWRIENRDSENMKPEPWNGNVSYLQALNLAEFGWAEGRDLMSDVACTMTPQELEVVESEALTMDVVGAYPIVPLALAGDPCHMVDVQAVETSNKIIKIALTLSFRANVDAKTVMTHGAAMLSYIDALESAGWRCEVWGRSTAKDDNGNKVTANICLKQAQDHIDIDQMAFVLANPAFTRRLIFRYRETFAKTQRGFAGGYGRTQSDNPGDCQAFIPLLKDNAMSDNDRALEHIADCLADNLKPAA